MSFNPSKCNILHVTRKKQPANHVYSLKGTPLEAVTDATYLGVVVSNNLSWHKHTAKVVAKGNKTLGFVRRNINTSSKGTKELAYKALVRPIMEYASTVWSPHQKELIHNIEMIQRRAARYIIRKYDRQESVSDMISDLSWETLEQRRAKARVVTGYRIVNGLVCIPDDQLTPSTTKTRGHSKKFRQIGARTNYYKYSFFPDFIPLWNSLPDSLVTSSTLKDFRTRLKDIHLKTINS